MVVQPTDRYSGDCGDATACDTLNNLLSNSSVILNDSPDLELKFLKGIHKVNCSSKRLEVSNKRNVTWYGDAVITCETVFTFVFKNIESLYIKGLHFSKCGGLLNSIQESVLTNLSAALILNNVHTLYMESVEVDHSSGYGLFTFNIYGNALIINSTFQYNNDQCISKSLQSSHNHCVGGNMMLYFSTRPFTLTESLNISIIGCIIEGGSDMSEAASSCEHRQEWPSSSAMFKANGLAVIMRQENYRVSLYVHKTNYIHNVGNKKHPAVLIHDYSDVTNFLEISDTQFTEEGVLLVSTIHDESVISKVNTSLETITIRNCTFNNGLSPSVYVCASPAKMSCTNVQYVRITDSTFYDCEREHSDKNAIVEISYNYQNRISFPSILIVLERCTFSNNTIPSISFHFNQDSFLGHCKQTDFCSSILTVKQSQFMPRMWSDSAIQVIGPRNSTILWRYDTRNTSFIEFSNCTFYSSIQINNTHAVLKDCIFQNTWTTAVGAKNAVIAVNGQNKFNNSRYGSYGGALRLEESILLLMPDSYTLFSENAARFGGGILATPIQPNFSKANVGVHSLCTITKRDNTGQVKIDFVRNRAPYSGHSIFGGNYINCLYNCTEKGECQVLPDTERFDLQHLPQYISINPYFNNTQLTEISSPATRICLCKGGKPTDQCSIVNVTAFPGQVFNISLVAIGKLNGITPIMVTSQTESFLLNKDSIVQVLSVKCTTVIYSVRSAWTRPTIQTLPVTVAKETAELIKFKTPENFIINIHMSPCPPGMEFLDFKRKCECISFFKKFDIGCDSKSGIIRIKENQWIGYYNSSHLATANNYRLDYLSPGNRDIHLRAPDEQCYYNRKGILCGTCQANLSMVLGTSNCKKCSNSYLLLIVPFALAGVALVILLLKCNLTVSVGHINGIIFYANIVQINKELFFKGRAASNQIFSVFIAWLNLDLGIESCFFENMDSYVKEWLQFIFPVYLWALIALIIILAHCSQRLGSLIGDNSVPVLATLFLLSYAKLCRVVIEAMSFTFIEFEEESPLAVWLMDGDILYFSSKHAALFLAALVFLLLYIIPYTLLVLLAPCLQARSHLRPFRWVNRLKPFLDAYQGPYTDKFRYWIGLLLIARVPLLIAATANFKKDLAISSFCTIVVTTIIVFILLKKAVYRHPLANWIELLSLVNVVILCFFNWLSTTTRYKELHSIGKYITYTSVAVMMLTFLGIILYQVTLKLNSNCIIPTKREPPVEPETTVAQQTDSENRETIPTSSTVELDQLREPLLDSD